MSLKTFIMSVPKQEDAFYPLLDVLAHGKPMWYENMRKRAKEKHFMHLDSIDLIATHSNGQPLLLNRMGWAKINLCIAGFIRTPARDVVQITEAGLAIWKRGTCGWKDLHATAEWQQKMGSEMPK
jgi:restriction endonuclease Mrr|tara:strand:+ start:347 stop:721 length:375 start_codon:yes stop_codon:yes gene_type:complete